MPVPSDALALFQQMSSCDMRPSLVSGTRLLLSMAGLNFYWNTKDPSDFVEVSHGDVTISHFLEPPKSEHIVGRMNRSHLLETLPAILKILVAAKPSEHTVRSTDPCIYSTAEGDITVHSPATIAAGTLDAPELRFKTVCWNVSRGPLTERVHWRVAHRLHNQEVGMDRGLRLYDNRQSPLRLFLTYSATDKGGCGHAGVTQTMQEQGAGFKWFTTLEDWAARQTIPHYDHDISLQASWKPDGDVFLNCYADDAHFGRFIPNPSKGMNGGFTDLTKPTGPLAIGTKANERAQQWVRWVLEEGGRDILKTMPLKGIPVLDPPTLIKNTPTEQVTPIVDLDLV